MKKTKRKNQSSKITKAANGVTCIKCGSCMGTVRACHYNGVRQHSYGKGWGIKLHDLMTAEFCDKCDAEFSEGSCSDRWESRWDRSEEFLHYIALTNIRRFNSGIIGAI